MKDFHCQNGHADVCWAARLDGITCPSDSCDVDDGLIDMNKKEDPVFTNEEAGYLMLALNVAATANSFLGGNNMKLEKINTIQEKLKQFLTKDDQSVIKSQC